MIHHETTLLNVTEARATGTRIARGSCGFRDERVGAATRSLVLNQMLASVNHLQLLHASRGEARHRFRRICFLQIVSELQQLIGVSRIERSDQLVIRVDARDDRFVDRLTVVQTRLQAPREIAEMLRAEAAEARQNRSADGFEQLGIVQIQHSESVEEIDEILVGELRELARNKSRSTDRFEQLLVFDAENCKRPGSVGECLRIELGQARRQASGDRAQRLLLLETELRVCPQRVRNALLVEFTESLVKLLQKAVEQLLVFDAEASEGESGVADCLR